jgi:hypothetical protein
MSTNPVAGTNPPPSNPDPAIAYQALYDALGKAYWDASTLEDKDLVHGAQEAIYNILTQIDQQDLENNTELFQKLKPTIDATNKTLSKIKDEIAQITKDISTAATVVSAISTVLSLFH